MSNHRLKTKIGAVLATLLYSSVLITSTASAAAEKTCLAGTGPNPNAAYWASDQSYSYVHGGWCMSVAVDEFDKYAPFIRTEYFRMVWQTNGNFVVYKGLSPNGPILWQSHTYSIGHWLNFQKNGQIAILNINHQLVWDIYPGINITGYHQYSLTIDTQPNDISHNVYLDLHVNYGASPYLKYLAPFVPDD